MISKELLSEVLGVKVKEIRWFKPEKSELQFDVEEDNDYTTINIHELAHKCKEWVTNKGYGIDSGYGSTAKKTRTYSSCCLYLDTTGCASEYFKSATEPEAVFKACEWIMENTK